MLIDIEQKCSDTHRWYLIARFTYAQQAITAAIALSKLDGGTYRVADRRWPEDPEGSWVTVYTNGELSA